MGSTVMRIWAYYSFSAKNEVPTIADVARAPRWAPDVVGANSQDNFRNLHRNK